MILANKLQGLFGNLIVNHNFEQMVDVLHIAASATKTTAREPQIQRNLWSKIGMFFRSKRQAVKIMKALNEAEQIHSGRKQGTTYDQFLKEI